MLPQPVILLVGLAASAAAFSTTIAARSSLPLVTSRRAHAVIELQHAGTASLHLKPSAQSVVCGDRRMGVVSNARSSSPRMQGLSEEEVQAKLDAMRGGSSTPRNAESQSDVGDRPTLPPLLGEIGLFIVVIAVFLGGLVVSLS